MTRSKDQLVFVPLGGLGEIGMNVYAYGLGDEWMLVDLGLGFAEREFDRRLRGSVGVLRQGRDLRFEPGRLLDVVELSIGTHEAARRRRRNVLDVGNACEQPYADRGVVASRHHSQLTNGMSGSQRMSLNPIRIHHSKQRAPNHFHARRTIRPSRGHGCVADICELDVARDVDRAVEQDPQGRRAIADCVPRRPKDLRGTADQMLWQLPKLAYKPLLAAERLNSRRYISRLQRLEGGGKAHQTASQSSP